MSDEEIYAMAAQEKLHKEEISNMWGNFKCPVCGEHNFNYKSGLAIINPRNLLSQSSSDKGTYVTAMICKNCGYVVLRADR